MCGYRRRATSERRPYFADRMAETVAASWRCSRRRTRGLLPYDGEEVARLGHSAQCLEAAVVELQTPSEIVGNRLGNKDLPRQRRRCHAGGDIDHSPDQVAVVVHRLAGMDADANFESGTDSFAELIELPLDVDATQHGVGWAGEPRQKAVALGAHFLPATRRERLARELAIAPQHPAPLVVAETLGEARRVHDVGEHHRHPLTLRTRGKCRGRCGGL